MTSRIVIALVICTSCLSITCDRGPTDRDASVVADASEVDNRTTGWLRPCSLSNISGRANEPVPATGNVATLSLTCVTSICGRFDDPVTGCSRFGCTKDCVSDVECPPEAFCDQAVQITWSSGRTTATCRPGRRGAMLPLCPKMDASTNDDDGGSTRR